ncbi:MAG: hypothetical protein M3Z24_14665 [Chloroflexota bacterium]|nr:hypothetical protein [Chloroflexota bacterium]
MQYVLASSDPLAWLAPWGQAAAIVLLFYLLVLVLIVLALYGGLMFGMTWVREKAELIKWLRPTVDSVNTTTKSAMHGALPPAHAGDNHIVRTVAEVPVKMHDIEQKIDEGSIRVEKAVIEFRARTEMVKGMAKAFFLPGLTTAHKTRQEILLEEQGTEIESPGFRMLMEAKAPTGSSGMGDSYAENVTASDLKGAPVHVVTGNPAVKGAPGSEVMSALQKDEAP